MNMLKYSFFFFLNFSLISSLSAQRDFKSLYKKSTQKPISSSLNNHFYQDDIKKSHDSHYVITLKNPFDYKKSCGWRVYFNGTKVFQEEGTFQFKGPKDPEVFHIVVAQIKTPNSHVIKHLEVPEGVNYKHFYLQRKTDLNNPENYKWALYETDGNKGFTIPENSLIIFLDPSYINHLEKTVWKKDTNIIPLPTITFTKDPNLEKASVKSILAALDTDPFHKKIKEQSKTEESIKMSHIG